MFKNQKKLFTCFALSALVLGCGSNVHAACIGQNSSNPIISVQSVNTAQSSMQLSISASGTASISANVVGKAGTSKIKMTVKLQKYNTTSKSWKKVTSWDKSSNSSNAMFSTSYKLSSKGTYRCKLTASVWKNGTEETVTATSGSQKY